MEDPLLAPAIARDKDEQPWIEARPGDDPLVMADALGRPMAILRLGGRTPAGDEAAFNYGAVEPVVFDQLPVEANRSRVDHSVEQAIPKEILIAPEEMRGFVTDQE